MSANIELKEHTITKKTMKEGFQDFKDTFNIIKDKKQNFIFLLFLFFGFSLLTDIGKDFLSNNELGNFIFTLLSGFLNYFYLPALAISAFQSDSEDYKELSQFALSRSLKIQNFMILIFALILIGLSTIPVILSIPKEFFEIPLNSYLNVLGDTSLLNSNQEYASIFQVAFSKLNPTTFWIGYVTSGLLLVLSIVFSYCAFMFSLSYDNSTFFNSLSNSFFFNLRNSGYFTGITVGIILLGSVSFFVSSIFILSTIISSLVALYVVFIFSKMFENTIKSK